MAALQVKQICVNLELADLTKIINTKLYQGEDRLTQTLVFPMFIYIYINIGNVYIHICLYIYYIADATLITYLSLRQ